MSFTTRSLDSITQNEWGIILKREAFRGHKIHRLVISFKTIPIDALNLDASGKKVSFNGIDLNLERIKACKARWSFARIVYLIKKCLFRMDQTDHNLAIRHLAEGIYLKLHPVPLSQSVKEVEREVKQPNHISLIAENEKKATECRAKLQELNTPLGRETVCNELLAKHSNAIEIKTLSDTEIDLEISVRKQALEGELRKAEGTLSTLRPLRSLVK